MTQSVPFIDIKRLVAKYRSEIDVEMKSVMDNCAFVGGPKVAELEGKLKTNLQTKHAIGASNGTDALLIALQAAGLKCGMKVAVPNLTFWATIEAIVHLGGVPVILDCDEHIQMDFESFKEVHKKEKLDFALLVHLYGWASQHVEDYREFCRSQNIVLVEDAAQAYGVCLPNGDSIFRDADIATLSFYPAKVIGANGDAGAIVTSKSEWEKECRILLNHGRSEHYSYSHMGWNARLSGLAASFLNVMLDHDQEILDSRRRVEKVYLEKLKGHPDFDIVAPPSGIKTNGYLNVCLAKEGRIDSLTQRLKDANIGFGRTYPETMSEQPALKNQLTPTPLDHSQFVTKNVVNLPLFAFMEDAEIDYVINTLD